jgi:hypothetical protein
MSHSPEPWSIKENRIADAGGSSVTAWHPAILEDEDMQRAVACVNFCRHLPTEYMLPRVLHRGAIGPMVDWSPEVPPDQWEKHGGPNTGGKT